MVNGDEIDGRNWYRYELYRCKRLLMGAPFLKTVKKFRDLTYLKLQATRSCVLPWAFLGEALKIAAKKRFVFGSAEPTQQSAIDAFTASSTHASSAGAVTVTSDPSARLNVMSSLAQSTSKYAAVDYYHSRDRAHHANTSQQHQQYTADRGLNQISPLQGSEYIASRPKQHQQYADCDGVYDLGVVQGSEYITLRPEQHQQYAEYDWVSNWGALQEGEWCQL